MMKLTIHASYLGAASQTVDLPPASVHKTVPFLTKAARAAKALLKWHKQGREFAPKTLREQRTAICNTCPFWNPEGNFSLGECRAPGCGCTRAKTWLLSEKCPTGKWPQ